jgi:hypothetical protein
VCSSDLEAALDQHLQLVVLLPFGRELFPKSVFVDIHKLGTWQNMTDGGELSREAFNFFRMNW